MTIEALKEAILALPRDERLALEEWLADEWDAEIEQDFSPGGRGAAVVDRVDAEIASGDFAPMKPRS
jgi:hypothetical protein